MGAPSKIYSFPKPALLVLGGLAWLCSLAALVFFVPRYLPDGEVFLFSDFDSAPSEAAGGGRTIPGPWQYSKKGAARDPRGGFGQSGGIKLTVEGKAYPNLFLDFSEPWKFSYLEFRGKMRTEGVVSGNQPWKTARFTFIFKDSPDARQWKHYDTVGLLSGTTEWNEFSTVIAIPRGAVRFGLSIINMGRQGTMWCDDILLRPLQVNRQYFFYRNLLLAAGGLLATAFLFRFRLWQNGGWLVILIAAAIGIGAMCSNQYFKTAASSLNIDLFRLKLVGHYASFVLMAVTAHLCLCSRTGMTGLIAALAGFAALTELLQITTLDRSPQLLNWTIDLAGILTGLLLAIAVRWLIKGKGVR